MDANDIKCTHQQLRTRPYRKRLRSIVQRSVLLPLPLLLGITIQQENNKAEVRTSSHVE